MLVVDDHGLAVRVHVYAVDRAREAHARILDLGTAAPEPPLEVARLEPNERARLVVQERREVPAQRAELPGLAGVVRNERLRQGSAAALELVLVREVGVELLPEHGARLLERRGVGNRGPHQASRGVLLRPRLEAPHRLAVGGELHRALMGGAKVRELVPVEGALLRAGEKLPAGDLEHAVREGAHLRSGEAGVCVAQPQAPEAEPLVGALEVRLDLRGGEKRPGILGGDALGRRGDALALRGVDPARGRRRLAPLPRGRLSRGGDVLAHEGLRARAHAPGAQGVVDLLRRRVRRKPVAGQQLGHHHRGVALLSVRAKEGPLQNETLPRNAHHRRKAGARLVHRARAGLHAIGVEKGVEHVVGRGDGRLGRGLAKEQERVRGKGGEAGGRSRGHQAGLARGAGGNALRSERCPRAGDDVHGKLHQLGEPNVARLGGVRREPELLQALGHAQYGGEHGGRLVGHGR